VLLPNPGIPPTICLEAVLPDGPILYPFQDIWRYLQNFPALLVLNASTEGVLLGIWRGNTSGEKHISRGHPHPKGWDPNILNIFGTPTYWSVGITVT